MENPIPGQPFADNTPVPEVPSTNIPEPMPNPSDLGSARAAAQEPMPAPKIVSMASALGVQPSPMPNSKPKWPVYLGGGLLTIVFISTASAAAALAFRVWDPMWNPFRPSPEEVLAKMAVSQKNFKTTHAAGNFSIAVSTEEGSMEVGADYDGDIDISDKENPKYDLGLSARFDIEGSGMNFGVQVAGAEGDTYVKLNSIGSLLAMFGADPSGSDTKKWIKYAKNWRSDLVKTLEERKEELQLSDQDVQRYRDEAAKDEEKDTDEQTRERVTEIIANAGIYKVAEELADEKIGDVEVYHYKVSLNNDNFKKALMDIAQTESEEGKEPMDSDSIGKFLAGAGEFSGDIWVGKKDNLFYRFKMEKKMDYNDLADAYEKEEESLMDFSSFLEDAVITLKLQIDLSDYDKEVKIEIPGDFEKAEDKEIETLASLVKSEEDYKNSYIKLYMDQIKSIASIIYNNNDPNSYTGLVDNQEFKTISDDMRSKAGRTLISKVSKQSYCVYTELLAGGRDTDYVDYKYWCIDSTGFAGGSDQDPSQKGYCDGRTFKCPASSYAN
ncbi:MAG: hypothetical protein WC926_04375 [Candidatus Paceibacterota bacterium]|jgi:hypothetical protein